MKADVKAMRDVLTSVATQMDSVLIRPEADGWHIYARSPDAVSLTDTHIMSSSFSDYEVWDRFQMKVTDLLDAMKTAEESVELIMGDGRMKIKSNGITSTRALEAVRDVEPRFPKMDTEIEVAVNASDLKRLIRASSKNKKYGVCRLEASSEGFSVSVMDDDSDLGEMLEIPAKDCLLLSGEGYAMYPVTVWGALVNAMPSDAVLDIKFDRRYPITASYGMEDRYAVRFMIAPRVESE